MALPKDLEENEINSIFDMPESVRIQLVKLIILPLL